MNTISDKITELGGQLAPPACASEIAQLEVKLGYSLPEGLHQFLKLHNGSVKETDLGIWKFWPCSEITTYSEYRGSHELPLDHNDLRSIAPHLSDIHLSGSRIILFADAMIDAPTYGLFRSPGHICDGMVFDCSIGYLSAKSFADWIAAFIEHGKDGLLLPPDNSTLC